MRFQNIKVTDAEVSMDRLDKNPDGSTLKTELTNPSRPLASFDQAMQAFAGFAVELVGAPAWHDQVKVSSIHLSEEPKTSRRGLIVTFTRKVERAKNRTVVVNTPLMHAPAEDQEGTNPGTFPKEVAEMIATVEAEATRYWKGEREQAEIFAEGTAAGAREEAAPGKPRGKKNKAFIPGGGDVVNADATVPPDDQALRLLLLDAGRDVPIDAIQHWNSAERDSAQRWGAARARVRSGDVTEAGVPKEPKILLKDAAPALIDA